MNFTAQDLWKIWADGAKEALTQMLLRPDGMTNIQQDIIFPAWDLTICQLNKLIPGPCEWSTLSQEEKIRIYEDKTFSFKNFEAMALGPQFELTPKGAGQ